MIAFRQQSYTSRSLLKEKNQKNPSMLVSDERNGEEKIIERVQVNDYITIDKIRKCRDSSKDETVRKVLNALLGEEEGKDPVEQKHIDIPFINSQKPNSHSIVKYDELGIQELSIFVEDYENILKEKIVISPFGEKINVNMSFNKEVSFKVVIYSQERPNEKDQILNLIGDYDNSAMFLDELQKCFIEFLYDDNIDIEETLENFGVDDDSIVKLEKDLLSLFHKHKDARRTNFNVIGKWKSNNGVHQIIFPSLGKYYKDNFNIFLINFILKNYIDL